MAEFIASYIALPITIKGCSLNGRVVLIVQRSWVIASALARAFEANGARVLLSTNPSSGLALVSHPLLSAAVLDSNSRELCNQLEARGIPFLFYTARDRIDGGCVRAPIVRKPASPATVIEGVQQLLTRPETPAFSSTSST